MLLHPWVRQAVPLRDRGLARLNGVEVELAPGPLPSGQGSNPGRGSERASLPPPVAVWWVHLRRMRPEFRPGSFLCEHEAANTNAGNGRMLVSESWRTGSLDLWLPGAQVIHTDHTGLAMNGQNGIRRATWHITWDVIDPRPPFINVANYLVSKGYEPTLMWNPETGEFIEFLPANVGGYALEMKGVETNRMGDINVQIEVYFSPGIPDGQGGTWEKFTDTPMKGAKALMEWLDQLGIPRTGPLVDGDYSRDQNRWGTESGHFGHINAPLNSHTDPAYPPDMAKLFAADDAPPTPPTPSGDNEMVLDVLAMYAHVKQAPDHAGVEYWLGVYISHGAQECWKAFMGAVASTGHPVP